MATGVDEDLRSRILVLESCMHGWERESKSLEGQNKSLQYQITNLEHQITNLEHQITNLEHQITNLEGQNKSLQHQIKDLEGENKSFKGQTKDLEDQNQSLQHQIKTLEDWQMYRETCAESDSLIWGTPFLLGTVGELFQWCLRRQPNWKSLSKLYWKRRWSRAVRRASTCLRMSPPDFARFADSCIDERNANAAHFQTLDGLVDAIQHCRHLLTRYPSLQAQFPKQSLAISNFELLRAVFIF